MREKIYIDFLIAAGVAFAANVVFNNFERHLPLARRIIKNAVLLAILVGIGLVGGRIAFWSAIALLTAGQVVPHAWWFPKNGVNGLTAEPRERYLELIAKMKSRDRSARRAGD